jgi:AcrR family transcriptional regulator
LEEAAWSTTNHQLDVRFRTAQRHVFRRGDAMTEAKVDRRVQKTRAAIQHALVALIVERGYEAVTVQDILDRANVGRSTFYAHFLDKQDVLTYSLHGLTAFLVAQRNQVRTTAGMQQAVLGFSLPMFQHAQEQQKLYQAVVGKHSGALIQQQMRRIFADLVRDDIGALVPIGTSALQLEMMVEYVVSAFQGLLSWWLDRQIPCSAEEVDRVFQRLSLNGIAALCGPN